MTDRLAGVVLAAGEGARLRPLTLLRPKALCPVGGVPLLDHALARVAPAAGSGPGHLAVNAHHGADLVVAHVGGRAHVSVESPEALGTAGALGALRDWVDGRDVLLTNADAYLPAGLGDLAGGWDGERCRLLCVPVDGRPDFTAPDGTGLRYVGACLLPWAFVKALAAEPTGLYEVLWAAQDALGRLDLVTTAGLGLPGTVVDCGTPAQYLAANLDAVRRAGGSVVAPGAVVSGRVEESVVGAGARVEGDVVRCVVWDGAHVAPGERLVDAVRAVAADDSRMTVTGDTGTLSSDQ
ncbi:NTP transferase domain-containing protein [Kineosporia sp. A_224]|uniref:nucleotidyltransferase family protein n=1 Tax=Kineosporia sp. A_224 TaxID=1962180 RepID=UPI000B4BF93B|nr:NTP transferase domain-containing protein [Kineosporia sp. A_224]